MEVMFKSTTAFEKDLRGLSKRDKDLVVRRINELAHQYTTSKTSFYSSTYRPLKIKLLRGYGSSLYSARINRNIRLVFAVDEDPLFDQLIFTLFRIALHPDDLSKLFASIAESLYQSNLSDLVPRETANGED